jgi:anti-sigma B factor antagonist
MRFQRSEALAITIEREGSTICLRLAGEFDLAGVPRVQQALEGIGDDFESLVFDLEQVEFLDLAALRTILRANDRGRKQGFQVQVVKPRGPASRIFTLTSLARELEFVEAPAPA